MMQFLIPVKTVFYYQNEMHKMYLIYTSTLKLISIRKKNETELMLRVLARVRKTL